VVSLLPGLEGDDAAERDAHIDMAANVPVSLLVPTPPVLPAGVRAAVETTPTGRVTDLKLESEADLSRQPDV